MREQPPYIVGLTGGIGSGKSTVADLFARLGVTLVDADAIAHALTGPGGAAIPAIRATFGDGFIDVHGALDRATMRAHVFGNDAERRRLEGILHPMIREESRRQVLAAASPYVIQVIPLLFESEHWREHFARVLVVDCPESEQIARVMQRSGLTEPQVRAIMARQVDRSQRLALAHDVIENSGELADLHEPVRHLHERYLKAAQEARHL